MFCIVLQMLKDFPTPVRWNSLEKRSMHHWKPTANRDTPNSREGKVSASRTSLVYYLSCQIKYNVLCSTQVCQAPSSTASTAIHRLEVPGAPLLLQADWWHTYWHFPYGNAWSSPSVVLDRKCVLWLGLDSWSLGSFSETGVAL